MSKLLRQRQEHANILAESSIQAQRDANYQTASLQYAQWQHTIATLESALATIDSALLQTYTANPANGTAQKSRMDPRKQSIERRLETAASEARALLGKLKGK